LLISYRFVACLRPVGRNKIQKIKSIFQVFLKELILGVLICNIVSILKNH
jgi:hypothetical protein